MQAIPLPLAQTAFASLNHLLRQQAWARDKLRAHAGQTVRIVVESPLGPVSACARIGDDGVLEHLGHLAGDPGATLTFTPSIDALFGFAREGARGLAGHLKVDGDVMVAGAVGEVAQHLRWDFEEDLSRVVGDRLAHRVGETARQGRRRAEDLRGRVESGVRQYLVDEQPTLVPRVEMQALSDRIRSLHRALDRLEAEMSRRSRQ
jgi:ubiquinone biosynthesis accessory factor UbiJ